MAAATAVSHARIRSKSIPTFRQSCRQSDAADPIELTRRLELYRLEEEMKKKYRRRSAGQYLTNQPLFHDHRLSFNIAEFNQEHLARNLDYHRRSYHADLQTQRPKSAHVSRGRPRSSAVEADKLARRLEAHLNSSRKDAWATHTPLPPRPTAFPNVNTNPTRSRDNSQKRPKPARPKSLPASAASDPRYHHTPTNAARDLSNTATTGALDATKAHRLSQGVLHRYANPYTPTGPKDGYNPRTLAAARQRTQAYNDALASRNSFRDAAVTAQATAHDRQRQRRHDGVGGRTKPPTRAEREALRHKRSLASLNGGNGNSNGNNGRHKPRPGSLPGPTTGHRSSSGRGQRFDSPQEDVPPIPCGPRLPSDRNDWTQADEAVAGDPSRLSVAGLARKLSRRSGGSSTSETETGTEKGKVVVPPTPTIVVSDEAERWREKALVMREEAVSRARALRERREWVGRSGDERARWKPVVGAGSGVAVATATTSSSALAAPPSAAPPKVPLPPPPVAMRPNSKRMTSDWTVESGTEHMTLESRRLLEQQMKLLRRRTLEENALREAVKKEREKNGRVEVPNGQRVDGSTPVLASSPGQQDRAESQRPAAARGKHARDELVHEKEKGGAKALKAPDAEKQRRRRCFGRLWS